MGYTKFDKIEEISLEENPRKFKQRYLLHAVLFLFTCISTLMAGVAWIGQDPLEVSYWHLGLTYSILLMTFITAHEFGHYFAAKMHKVEATLPYFIPFPLVFLPPFFGTMGALIKTRSPITSRKALFDIGVAGPIAGFVVSLVTLIVGFSTLPSKEYLFSIHPEYAVLNGIPNTGLHFGETFLYTFLAKIFVEPGAFLPPMNEMYHYPFLCVGWFGLFVTSLNLLPIGQLDGGHIIYGMFGEKQAIISKIFWFLILVVGLGSFSSEFYSVIQNDSPNAVYTFFQELLLPFFGWLKGIAPWYFGAWGGWLFWAIFTRLFIRIEHPAIPDETPIGFSRMIFGWIAIVIFFASVSIQGFYFTETASMKTDGIVQQK